MDTIFARATAAGKAGVAVIRISGSDALVCSAKLGAELSPHDRKLVLIRDFAGEVIDEAFALSFAPGRSFTGEQVVEFQTHGSTVIVDAVLRLLSQSGARMAEAGEFTRRALENGQMDLARVEGLADLIDAETEGQRRQAMRVFSGALGDLSGGGRHKLVRAAALIEATIDFVDEDVPVDVYPEVFELVREVLLEVSSEARGVGVRERLREGFEIALVGPPNAGKSTLLNRLAGRDAAITSDLAGTTRDVLEVRLDLNGLPVTILDTAGLRDASDQLEEMGIQRGIARAALADVRVHLSPDGQFSSSLEAEGLDLFVQSKADLDKTDVDFLVSAKTGEGIEELLARIEGHLSSKLMTAGIATRERHAVALRKAEASLNVVIEALHTGDILPDLLADELIQAIRALDSLIGRVDVENVLDEIFSSFCIGK